ncbi:hypothetical protein CKAN_00959900 [Cinnamomum micranthum f. kanehirae]|uniref:Uncharacterized protein n=1 Tax=Cinnamomum micranthum f. kanehirae TaxID=337451 RepID=A0A443NQZ7_9MAGN|nr:hypothetical protein CKAN_00959900 [Cinnamomum micranthum f. kanehirae]
MGSLSKFFGVIVMVHVLLSIHPSIASRVLCGDEVWKTRQGLVLESLQRGPVPPSGRSGCTYVAGKPGPSCLVNEMNVAGSVFGRANAYPELTIPFGVATN